MKIFKYWVAEKQRIMIDGTAQELGTRHSLNDVIRCHDDLTGVNYRQPLA